MPQRFLIHMVDGSWRKCLVVGLPADPARWDLLNLLTPHYPEAIYFEPCTAQELFG